MHCASPMLNLVISKASSVADMSTCVSIIKDITKFVRSSAKCKKSLQQSIKFDASAQKSMSLTTFCETRQVERNNNVTKFVGLLSNVRDTLEKLMAWSDTTAAVKALQYLFAKCFPKLIVSLWVCARFSKLLFQVSKLLQSPDLDLTKCAKEISGVE